MRFLRAVITGVLIGAVAFGGFVALAQTETVSGELKRLSRIWDGTDVWLIDGSGNGMVGDGTGPLTVDGTVTVTDGAGALNVIVDSSALPSGAATSANQDGIVRDGTGDTTQANVSSGRLHVDGSGVTQPISAASLPLPTGAATSAAQDGIIRDGAGDTTQANVNNGNVTTDILRMNGVAVLMGNGASGTGAQRVTVADDSTGEIRVADDAGNQIPSSTAAMALNSRGLNVRRVSPDPCGNEKATPFNVNLASATTTLVATGVGSEHVYICAVNIMVGGAQGLAFIAGTGATCGTSTAGMNGGTTGATGWQMAANGGIVLPAAGFSHMSTEISGGATGDSVCIVTSTAAQTSGTISYVIQAP